MPYIGEASNPFGLDDFLKQIGEEDFKRWREIKELIEKLAGDLNKPDVRKVSPAQSHRGLITVAVDGGSSLVFPQHREISLGMVRVCAYSSDLQPQLEPAIVVIKNHEVFDILRSDLSAEDLKNKRHQYIDALFSQFPLKEFSEQTGIKREDLGEYIYKDLESFSGIIRSVLEWAYIVYIAKEYRNLKVVLVRDGRLEQHGVKNDFIKKLKDYFERNKTYIVGVVKSTKLAREFVASSVIQRWLSCFAGEYPIYFKIPNSLMEYTFRFERQWNPEFDESFVFGYRYLGKFLTETFHPMQAVITFDIPWYLDSDSKAVAEIVSTLFKHRSVLYGGSISAVSEAHARASIDSSIARTIEAELRVRIERETGLKIPDWEV
jgi:hypothetical protein